VGDSHYKMSVVMNSPSVSSPNRVKSVLSPSRHTNSSSAATALSSINKSMKKTVQNKSAPHTPAQEPMAPSQMDLLMMSKTPKRPTTGNLNHLVGIEISKLYIKNTFAKFNNQLSLKLSLDGEVKAMQQKGFHTAQEFSTYDINDIVTFNTKTNKPRFHLQVIIDNKVLASSTLPFNIDKFVNCPMENNNGELSKWNKFSLVAQLNAGKHVQMTEVIGDIEVSFDLKEETYWSDSETEGSITTGSTANSTSTTPASLIGSIQKSKENHSPMRTNITPKSILVNSNGASKSSNVKTTSATKSSPIRTHTRTRPSLMTDIITAESEEGAISIPVKVPVLTPQPLTAGNKTKVQFPDIPEVKTVEDKVVNVAPEVVEVSVEVTPEVGLQEVKEVPTPAPVTNIDEVFTISRNTMIIGGVTAFAIGLGLVLTIINRKDTKK
jgi:hypothetical protein